MLEMQNSLNINCDESVMAADPGFHHCWNRTPANTLKPGVL